MLYKHYVDQLIKRCVPKDKMHTILHHCHSLKCGGHYGESKTPAKLLQCGFYWPSLFKDGHTFVMEYDRCQKTGNISRRNEMPLNSILGLNSLTYGELISWGNFPHLTTTNTYCWWWIMFPNGLK